MPTTREIKENQIAYFKKSIQDQQHEIELLEKKKAREAEKFAYKGEAHIRTNNQIWDENYIQPAKNKLAWMKQKLNEVESMLVESESHHESMHYNMPRITPKTPRLR